MFLMDKEKEITFNPKTETDCNIDRLSNLPDHLLTNNILSLLKAREVIQTCILSKRWLKLWSFVPCLNFDIRDFKNDKTMQFPNIDLDKFWNFINMFLHFRHDSTDINTFQLECWAGHAHSKSDISACFKTWIVYALNHNVKNVIIDFSLYEPLRLSVPLNKGFRLPDCLFACESLETLDLDIFSREVKMDIRPDKICLPKLKKLILRRVYLNGDYMDKFLVGCPVLENLSMIQCTLETKNISSQTLKYLSIRFCKMIGKMVPTEIVICAPNARYLNFEGVYFWDEGLEIIFKEMSNLSKACLSVGYPQGRNARFVDGLFGLEDLTLIGSEIITEMLEGESTKWTTFHNMKNLSLSNCCINCAFGLLSSFIKRCPNLENLYLVHFERLCQDHERHAKDENNKKLEQIEMFSCERLKTVKVKYNYLNYGTNFLLDLLAQSTKEIKGVQFILKKH